MTSSNCGLPDGATHPHVERCYEAGEADGFARGLAAGQADAPAPTAPLMVEERDTLLVCPRCGGKAHSHTWVSREAALTQGREVCDLDVMGCRVAAVEAIVASRLAAIAAPFRPGGEFEPCPPPDDSDNGGCGHGECETAYKVLELLGYDASDVATPA